jgi:peroxiredoxin
MRFLTLLAATASLTLLAGSLDIAPAGGRAAAPGASSPPAGPTPASRPPAIPIAAPAPAGGRASGVEDAMRALDLIKPGRVQRAPDFTLTRLDGKRFRLADQRGKAVLVNFWATWCPPCLEEMPALERLWRRNRGEAFVLVGVALDANTALVPPFASEQELTFPVLLDSRMEVSNAYAVRALPTTVVIDRQGDVRALALGPRVWDNDAAHALVRGLAR